MARAISLAIFAWLAALALLGLWRDQHAVINAFDTGIYLQVLSNLRHYGDLASSVTGEANFLAHHFQPVIILLAPLVWLVGRAATLLLVGAFAVALTAWPFLRLIPAAPAAARPLMAGTLFGFCAHPGIAASVWHGFQPDILALPAFGYLTRALMTPSAGRPRTVIAALVWSGLCKESFWLTGAVAGYAFFAARGDRRRALGTAAACLAVFGLLFLVWMPAHSQLPSYYGLSYYFDATTAGPWAKAWELVVNAVSAPSAASVFWLVVLTAGLPFLWGSRCLAGAVPGALLVLVSRSPLVHHPGNHYLLSVLPFLLGASFENSVKLAGWGEGLRLAAGLKRYLPYALVAWPAAFTLLGDGETIDAAALIAKNPRTAYWRRDAERIAATLPADAPLIVDGSLMPLFAAHRDTTVLLAFTGNPVGVPETRLTSAAIVVTTEDLKAPIACEDREIGGAGLEVDAAAFTRLCARVQADGQVLGRYPDSGLNVYRLAEVSR